VLISKLKGVVSEKTEKSLCVTLFDSISFELLVVSTEKYDIGQEYLFFVVMLFSVEKGYILYGFSTSLEKLYFLLFQDCHGIGPKIALLVLNKLSIDLIYSAIITENKSVFEGISGIGKKKAELLVIELKSKISKLPVVQVSLSNKIDNNEDLVSALKTLGYNQKEIQVMVQKVYALENIQALSLSQLIQKALQLI
jgi:Holliday junction DNA helicase RuvA